MEQCIDKYLSSMKREVMNYADSVDMDSIRAASQIIIEQEKKGNRVHISGIGKPSYVAGYVASLMSSTGTPTYFLHGTEAVHGSSGQLKEGDVVIFISNSGETQEMKASVSAAINNGCIVIGVTGNKNSWLAKNSVVHLLANVSEEGGPLNRAPRNSILIETIVLHLLSVCLQDKMNVDPKQYVKWHPGGSLGKLRENEK